MADFLEIAGDVLADSLADTLYLIPFLFLTYLLMEWLEHKTGAKTQTAIKRAGAAGPAIGAILGVVPQCGFSAMSATLWAGRVVTLGTLFAVFLSTSDEMLPIFLAEQVPAQTILKIMGTKLGIGLVMGFLVDAALRLARPEISQANLRIHELCKQDNCHCTQDCATCEKNPELVYAHHDDCADGCTHEHHEHDHGHDNTWAGILKCALIHTAQVTAFIFIITVVLNSLFAAIGEDTLAALLAQNSSASVFASALVGLIPNCAASVCIAQLYVEGILNAGAMLSGLLVSGGVGLLVMCRANRHWKQNLCIIVALYAIGVIWGLLVNAIGIIF